MTIRLTRISSLPGDRAWRDLSEAQQEYARLFQDPNVERRVLRHHLERAWQAEKRWKRAMVSLNEAPAVSIEARQARLACEGFALFSLICGFTGLFLPDFGEHLWPLVICFLAIAGLGGWSVHYIGRLAAHFGR